MNCPTCGNADVHHYELTKTQTGNTCLKCNSHWTDWQQREIERLKSLVISAFYENGYPEFEQGEPIHELQEVFSAKDADELVAKISELQKALTDAQAKIDRYKELEFQSVQRETAAQTRIAELESSLKVMGATCADNGDLEIDMKAYHTLRCKKCEKLTAAQAEVERLKLELRSEKESNCPSVSVGGLADKVGFDCGEASTQRDVDISRVTQIQQLGAKLTAALGMLRSKEWTPCDDFCDNILHEEDYKDEDDEHHRSCMWCGAMQCEGHRASCEWTKLAALFEGVE